MPKRPTAAQKAASRRNLEKARAARNSPDKLHGSGTGLSSAYRYLPSIMTQRMKNFEGQKVPQHESVKSMSQKAAVAAKKGMTSAAMAKKHAAEQRKQDRLLKKQIAAKFAGVKQPVYRTKKGGTL